MPRFEIECNVCGDVESKINPATGLCSQCQIEILNSSNPLEDCDYGVIKNDKTKERESKDAS